jgi:TPR repeat protein
LADLFAAGRGTPVDLAAARHWYEVAAEGRSAYAARRLAEMLMAGEGGPADLTRGWSFLTMAALEGDREARNIGRRMLPTMPDRVLYDAAQVRFAWEQQFRPERHPAPSLPAINGGT